MTRLVLLAGASGSGKSRLALHTHATAFRLDDFYFDAFAQVHMPTWSSGRVGLVGDAGYCASPLSGMGTSLALVGAYLLAGELGVGKTAMLGIARSHGTQTGFQVVPISGVPAEAATQLAGVHQLLLALVLQNHREAVESPHGTAQLKSVGEINDHRNIFLTNLVQKTILQIQQFNGHRAPPPIDSIPILLD